MADGPSHGPVNDGPRAGNPPIDVFGHAVTDYHRDKLAQQPIYERSDGDESPAHCAWYFAGPTEWGPLERAAMDAVRGWVLDAGCGPGRALDPLGNRGHDVLGIDESPGAVRVAREWTDEPAIVGDQATLPLATGTVDSALFLGTHVGAAGTVEGVRSTLDELDRALSAGGRIVADCYDPTAVEDPDLRGYLEDRFLDDEIATRRFRLRYDGDVGRWRTLLMASPEGIGSVVDPTPWSIARIEHGGSDGDTRYLFVLERDDAGV